MEVSVIVEEWLRLMSGIQGARVAAILQERYQPLFDSRFNQDLNAEPESDLEGRHVLVKGDTRTEGFFHNGRLIGNVLETSKQERALYFCKRGVKHGFWHKVDTRNGTVLELGRYENGAKAGVWWRRLEGDGFLVREYSAPDDYAVFVYPDFKTCLEGTFEDLVMLSATENTVDRVKEDFGILVPVLKSKTDKSQVFYKREDRNSESICSSPQLPDPYESKSVQVRESGIPNAGEGLFAREAIKAGRVLAYFNGAVSPGSSSSSGQLKSSEYSIALDEKSVLDIPEGCRASYCASLAHKICHSFSPNAHYSYAFHPRFGFIRSAVSNRLIQPGEEITCDYKYSFRRAPDWYKASLVMHLQGVVGYSQDQIDGWIKSQEDPNSGNKPSSA